jgi:hypothetical protein
MAYHQNALSCHCSPFAQPGENHRGDDEDANRLLSMPPTTGVARGFMTSAPVRWLQRMGSRLATMVATVMTFGRRRKRAPSLTRRSSRRDKPSPRSAHFAFHGFLQVDDHDDAGLDGGAEERDVTDPDGDAEIAAEQPLQKHAAGQGEGDGEDDVRGFLALP